MSDRITRRADDSVRSTVAQVAQLLLDWWQYAGMIVPIYEVRPQHESRQRGAKRLNCKCRGHERDIENDNPADLLLCSMRHVPNTSNPAETTLDSPFLAEY